MIRTHDLSRRAALDRATTRTGDLYLYLCVYRIQYLCIQVIC